MKKLALVILGLGITFSMSGCGNAALSVMGMDGNSAGGNLRGSDTKFSKEVQVEMQKNKAYVVLISGKRTAREYLYEDVNNKLLLVGSINKRPGKAIIEVEVGKHTYVGSSSCGAYTIEINAQAGKVYYIQDVAIKKLSTMSYCRGQSAFQFFSDAVPSGIFKDYTNFVLINKNTGLANSLISGSSLPLNYKEFKENKETVNPRLKVIFPSEFAASID